MPTPRKECGLRSSSRLRRSVCRLSPVPRGFRRTFGRYLWSAISKIDGFGRQIPDFREILHSNPTLRELLYSLAIEVKASTRWSDSDLGGLRAFLAGAPHCRGGILAYGGRESVALGDRLFALPMSLLLG